jgi:hypothetical protein
MFGGICPGGPAAGQFSLKERRRVQLTSGVLKGINMPKKFLFMYKEVNHDIMDLLDGFYAYDHGATDSGIKDDSLKKALFDHLKGLDDKEQDSILSHFCQRYLTDEAISAGYGIEDVLRICEWWNDNINRG